MPAPRPGSISPAPLHPAEAAKPRRLGRGLSALLADPVAVPVEMARESDTIVETTISTGKASRVAHTGAARGATPQPEIEGLVHLPLESIEPSRFQPRRIFDEASIKGLAESIKSSGLMQPVIVRVAREQVGDSRLAAQSGREAVARFELVAGERRWRAAKLAGLRTIPAIVRELSDQDAAQWALVENVQREDLNPMERAWAFRSLAERFGLTHAQIAERVGLDRASVANAVRLTELEEPIRDMLAQGSLSGGHGKALLTAPAGPGREMLAHRAAKQGWSVRQLERMAMDAARAATPLAAGLHPPAPRESELRAAASRAALEKQIGEHLGTKVRINTNRAGNRGRLSVEFYGLDHFDGLLAKIGFQMR